MNCPTVDRWKKVKVETSLADASRIAGLTSLRTMAMEKRCMVEGVERVIVVVQYL